eukprot:scpid66803/ scgid15597/ ADP-dependent glucokinase
MISNTLLLAVFFALAGIFLSNSNNSDEKRVLKGWKRQLNGPAIQYDKVAVGLNANLDLIVYGTQLLKKLNVAPGPGKDHAVLDSLAELQDAFALSHSSCSAAERIMTSPTLYKQIVDSAASLEEKKYFVGGNAALMSQAMVESSPGSQVMLVGAVGETLRSLLNSTVSVPESCLQKDDEVHLILEYSRGEKWGDNVASCANRFIFSHDVANGELQPADNFASALSSFSPQLVVVAGLHLMDNTEESFWLPRVKKVLSAISTLPASTPVHLELASIGNLDFLARLGSACFSSVQSIGLNEQELMAISKANKGPFHNEELVSGPPEAAVVADVLHWMLKHYSGKLSRVHFHSLTFHVVAEVAGRWNNSFSAVGAAARVAGRRACQVQEIDPEKVQLKFPKAFVRSILDPKLRREPIVVDPNSPVSTWQRDGINFYLSPVLVCRRPLKTVGLGDAISATGLLYSHYIPK